LLAKKVSRNRALLRKKESARQERVRKRLLQALTDTSSAMTSGARARPTTKQSAKFMLQAFEQAKQTLHMEDSAREAKAAANKLESAQQTKALGGYPRPRSPRQRSSRDQTSMNKDNVQLDSIYGRRLTVSPVSIKVRESPKSRSSIAARRAKRTPTEAVLKQMVRRLRRVPPGEDQSSGFMWPPQEHTERLSRKSASSPRRPNHTSNQQAQRQDAPAPKMIGPKSFESPISRTAGEGTSTSESNMQ